MTVRELYNKLQELPLERFDDEVKIWYADGDRFDVDFVDDSIDGVIELNVGPYEDDYDKYRSGLFGSGAGSGPSSENRIIAGVDFDDVWNSLQDAMKPILKDYKDKMAKKDNNHPSIH
jgi:hypothetical protein